MKKEDLVLAGISEEVAAFVMGENRDNRALNQEGMEIGDKITITGIADRPSKSTIEGAERQWVDVLTTGDRQTVSISRLVGTQKVTKYFNPATRQGETEDGDKLVEVVENLKGRNILRLPVREGDALAAVAKNCLNKTYEVVGIARDCGRYQQTFYLFAEA